MSTFPMPESGADSSETLLPRLRQKLANAKAEAREDLVGAILHGEEDASAALQGLARVLALPLLRLHDLNLLDTADFGLMDFAACAKQRCALFRAGSAHVEIGGASRLFVVTDPFDVDLQAWARSRFGRIEVALVAHETFDAWLAQAEASLTALGALDAGGEHTQGQGLASGSTEYLDLRLLGGDESPVIRLVNSLLYDALKAGASDVHLECVPEGLAVKFRIDGVLTAIRRVDSSELATQAISRIKVMAQLDIAERRIPQDGRLQLGFSQRSIDVRVSIMPSIHGEDAVLRILDRQHLAQSLSGLTLAKLGFAPGLQSSFLRLCQRPHGMVLVTGPTGSGKTTTLYAAIAQTHEARDKVITIEDPVEYQLQGVLQIPVNERKGLTFAKGLRSILRHDPDKILVGEIRDSETATIAVQSALTGHLVFTTVHANTVFDVVSRFEQFGIDGYTWASAVNGVLAQRLVRRLCDACARTVPDEAWPAEWAEEASQLELGRPVRLRVAVGCEQCRGTGFAGRFAIAELLPMSAEVRDLISRRAGVGEIQKVAKQLGWRSMRSLALEAAGNGLTSVEEADRVAI